MIHTHAHTHTHTHINTHQYITHRLSIMRSVEDCNTFSLVILAYTHKYPHVIRSHMFTADTGISENRLEKCLFFNLKKTSEY